VIEVSFDVGLTEDQKALEGPLDPDQVFYQYVCQTTDGGHDPEGTPDERVRPSHAALHGLVFRLDDPTAPIPPIDFGCRCAMAYVGKPDSLASRIFGAEAPTAPTTRPVAFAGWLATTVPDLSAVVRAVIAAPPASRLAVAWDELTAQGVREARDVARMVVEAVAAGALTATGGK
jgi:hypothetical protein